MTEESESRGSFARKHLWKLLVSLAIAGGFVWLLRAGTLPLLPSAEALARVQWWTFAAYFALWSSVHWVRAYRWKWLLEPIHPVPTRKILAVSFIGYAAIVFLPFRTGEMVRPVLIRKKGHLSGWAVLGTVGAERVLDGLVLTAMMMVGLQFARPLNPLPTHIGALQVSVALVPAATYLALGVFVTAFLVMAAFYWSREWARRTTEKIFGLVSPKLGTWLSDRIDRLTRGFRFLPRARYTIPFFAATVVYWLLNSAGTMLLAHGVGLRQIGYAEACVGTGLLALGILVPNAPGFFGAFQASVYAGFAMYVPSNELFVAGAAYVFLVYLAQLAITVGGALLGMKLEPTNFAEAFERLIDDGDGEGEDAEPASAPGA